MKEALVTFFLDGTVNITGPANEPLTPRNAKARALVVLLATRADGRCSRRWVEGLLWSTRSHEQASGSLRQSLAALRRALGSFHVVIRSDRQEIWIEPGTVQVIAPQVLADLALGLKTRDPAFDGWLNSQRLVQSSASIPAEELKEPCNEKLMSVDYAAAERNNDCADTKTANVKSDRKVPKLLIHNSLTDDPLASAVSDLFNHQVAQNLSENINLELGVPTGSEEQLYCSGSQVISVKTSTTIQGRQAIVFVKLIDEVRRTILFSRHQKVTSNISHLLTENHLYQVAHQASEAALSLFSQTPDSATSNGSAEVLYTRAMTELFSFEAPRLRVADDLFKAIYKVKGHPVLLAWRAFVKLIMYAERTEPDDALLFVETERLCAEALERAADNALVLAIVGQIKLLLFGEINAAARLARDAVNLNSGNAMANLSLATVLLRCGDTLSAQQHARKALGIVSLSSDTRHWFYMACCLADFAAKAYDNSIRNAEYALTYAPHFKPPMRHLYAMYLHTGQHNKATEIVNRLRKIEPGFSLEMIRNNDNYPAGLLRASPLIDLADSKHLSVA